MKTHEIQNNLLDLMSNMIEYENRLRSGHQFGGHQLDPNYGNKVLVNKTVFETIKQFLPKIDKNVAILSEMIDKTVAQNETLTQELTQCRRRESLYERQLQEVRNLYHNLKDEMDWNEVCLQTELEAKVQTQRQDNCLKSANPELMKTREYLKTSLALIWSSGQNQRTVLSFMENEDLFREFMATIRAIFEEQITALRDYHSANGSANSSANGLANSSANDWANGSANSSADSLDISFDPNLIETISGISVNVFQCNDYSGEDIPEWIDCFTAVQALDKRFVKSSVNALHYICFAPNGTEELQKKPGIVPLLANCLTDAELKHEFRLKTNAVKVIRRLIESSKDTEIGVKLCAQFVDVIAMDRFRQMVAKEVYIQLKKGMAGLLTTLSQFNTSQYSITED